MHKGIIPLFAIIIGVVIAALAAVGLTGQNKLEPSPSPEIVEVIASPTPTPTATPTPTPTIAPSTLPTTGPTPTPIAVPVSGPPGSGLSTVTVATAVGNFRATVLSVNLSTSKMVTDTANDGDCGTGCNTKTLADFVSQNGGYAGVNGTYFCPASYAECSHKTDSFDFPVYNSRLNKWINSYSIGWGGRSIVYTDGSGAHYHQNAAGFGGGLNAGIMNYPGLVDGGNVQIDDNQSGLSDKQKIVGTKVGIGTSGTNNIMVVVAYGVNMQQFAHVFKSLGAVGAVNLDTGGSAALYYQGKYVVGPGRNIPNAVVIVSR